jgi:hypothetical protein
MLNVKNKWIKSALLLAFAFLINAVLLAQPGNPGCSDDQDCEPNYSCVDGDCVCNNWGDCGPCGGWPVWPYDECRLPIDENIWILILLGSSMGIYQFLKYHKRGA